MNEETKILKKHKKCIKVLHAFCQKTWISEIVQDLLIQGKPREFFQAYQAR